jgi:hypothetical protein
MEFLVRADSLLILCWNSLMGNEQILRKTSFKFQPELRKKELNTSGQ